MTGLLRRWPKNFAWLLLVLVVAGLLSYWPLCVRGAEVSASVGEANVAVHQAFNATLDAERAGANVSGLIVRLNEAGSILEEAEIALRNGDSNGAANNASLCIRIAERVKSDAGVLKASALVEAQKVFWTYLAFSVLGIALFAVVWTLVWRWFKRDYVRKMFGMKPEVAASEA